MPESYALINDFNDDKVKRYISIYDYEQNEKSKNQDQNNIDEIAISRIKRQDSSLQQTLQTLQNTQRGQPQGQITSSQSTGPSGSQGTGGFNTVDVSGSQGTGGFNTGEFSGFSNGLEVSTGFSPGTGGFNNNNQVASRPTVPGQGIPNNQFSNQGNRESGVINQNQAGGLGFTTVRNPLNVMMNENVIEEAFCVRRCPSVNNYNPVCGNDNVTYSNEQKLRCAQRCGRSK